MVPTARQFVTKPLSEAEERRFFETIQLANGTFKTTAFKRLDDLNRMVGDRWRKMGASPHQILDVGASSGITSVEWVEHLASEGFDVSLTATDLVFDGHLVALSPGLDILLDNSGHVLQYVFLGTATSGFPGWMLKAGFARIVRSIADAIVRLRGRDALLARSKQKIVLAHGRARNHPRIVLLEDDLFAAPRPGMAGRYDAIRAANILNLGYFGTAELARAITSLKARLSGAGASLIVVRTLEDGSNHGSLFPIDKSGRFVLIDRIGSGSEIEALVLGNHKSNRAE
jgi:hypothetical protein